MVNIRWRTDGGVSTTGGYPIMAGGVALGGIGVGGGSAQQDQEIAEAALAAIA